MNLYTVSVIDIGLNERLPASGTLPLHTRHTIGVFTPVTCIAFRFYAFEPNGGLAHCMLQRDAI